MVGRRAGVPLDMRMRGHRRLRRQVAALVDGEVRADEAAAVNRHLDECWDCSDDAEILRLMKVALARLAGREPADVAARRLRRWAEGLGPQVP